MSTHEMTVNLARRNGPRVLGDHIYFTGFSLLVLMLIFWAFAPTYFLAGAYHKPVAPPFIVVHGAMMTGWILLLLAQALLAAVGRISWHKRVGDVGFAYAATLVPIGCIAVTTSAAREVHGHTSFMLGELNVLGISLTQMFLFGALAGAAYLLRHRVDYHKRLVVLATLSVLPNAVVRLGQNVPAFGYIQTNLDILNTWAVFALFVIALDALRIRRLHPAFMVGGSLAFVALYLSWLISRTPAWDQFWVHSLT